MFRALQSIPISLLLLIATTLAASGDAVVRLAIYQHAGLARVALLLAGAALLLGDGLPDASRITGVFFCPRRRCHQYFQDPHVFSLATDKHLPCLARAIRGGGRTFSTSPPKGDANGWPVQAQTLNFLA
jgi:hypothetical protein